LISVTETDYNYTAKKAYIGKVRSKKEIMFRDKKCTYINKIQDAFSRIRPCSAFCNKLKRSFLQE